MQYSRRTNVELSGIPKNIPQKDLESEVIKVFDAAEVKVHGRSLEEMDIQACHRVGKKGDTIVRFVNQKFASEGLYCGRNLKGKNIYGNDSKVYINTSFCKEFKFLNYLVRKAKNDDNIFRWKVRNGITYVQTEDGGDFHEISHKNDLIDLNLMESE